MVLTKEQTARLAYLLGAGGIGEPGVVGVAGAQMTMDTFMGTIGNLALGIATGGLSTIASGIANAISNDLFGQDLMGAISSGLGLGGLDSIGDVGGPGADPGVVGFATGGIVPRDMRANVHKGEGVFTPEQMRHLQPSGAGVNITIKAGVITTNEVDSWLADRVRKLKKRGNINLRNEIVTAGLN